MTLQKAMIRLGNGHDYTHALNTPLSRRGTVLPRWEEQLTERAAQRSCSMVRHCRHGVLSFLHRLEWCFSTARSSTIQTVTMLSTLHTNCGGHRSMSWIWAWKPVLRTVLTNYQQRDALPTSAEALRLHHAAFVQLRSFG